MLIAVGVGTRGGLACLPAGDPSPQEWVEEAVGEPASLRVAESTVPAVSAGGMCHLLGSWAVGSWEGAQSLSRPVGPQPLVQKKRCGARSLGHL